MVGIKNFLRLGDVFFNPAFLAPWQAQQHVKIIAHNGRLGAHRLHAPQFLQFGASLGLRLFGKLGFLNLLSQLGDLVAIAIIRSAQLALDRLQLFVEVIFALGLFHLAFDPAADLAFHLQYRQFAFHKRHHQFQPFERAGLGQDRLFVGHFGAERGRDCIGQFAGIIDIGELDIALLTHLLVELGIFAKLLDHLPHQGGDFAACDGFFLGDIDLGKDVIAFFAQAGERGAVRPFDQDAHSAIGQFEQLQHLRNHADIIQVIPLRIIRARIKLSEEEDILRCLHRRLERGNRFVAAHKQGDNHAGENDNVAKGQKGEMLCHKKSVPGDHRKGKRWAAACLMNMGSVSRSRNGGFHEAVDADRQVLRPKGELCGAIGPQTPHMMGARHCRAMPTQGAIAPARSVTGAMAPVTHLERCAPTRRRARRASPHAGQVETRGQPHRALHLFHLFFGHPIGLVARIIECSGNKVFDDILLFDLHQAVIDAHTQNPPLGRGAHFDQTTTGLPLNLDRVELDLHIAHLFLDRLSRLLGGLHHFFHAFHGMGVLSIISICPPRLKRGRLCHWGRSIRPRGMPPRPL